jgi:hypothetical protein
MFRHAGWRPRALFLKVSAWKTALIPHNGRRQVTMDRSKRKPERVKTRDSLFHLAGWILFIVCALFYLASSIISRDYLAFAGSLIFLIACFIFVYPLLVSIRDTVRYSGPSEERQDSGKPVEPQSGSPD